ncbi:hypothetical protein B5G54_06490 [Ralstonia solanacearum]|nr:hypothetical protein CDC59_11985 [Ralstonia solanacearum]KEI33966.1 hypothetical protein CQ06_02540 [Ralstonia solanacearum]KFX83770.1 hypothetical protein KR99_10300 [Ralstonia solanacearum]OCQ64470.1 hypothetical protein AR464_15835 [Ralstonia solanacearum]OCQ64620.1 hypothetical protein AR465_11215 [Ralstonia solanacearum]
MKNIPKDDLRLKKKTKDEYWAWDTISDESAYKYFKKASAAYLKKVEANPQYDLTMDFFKERYLKKDYFGQDFNELRNTYYSEEASVKKFVREAFIQVFPITPGMTPHERAIRNQKLGKISTQHWIGDITNYDYLQSAPNFMIERVTTAVNMIELYVANLLNEPDMGHEISKLITNQRLVEKLQLKEQQVAAKPKINKI